MLPLGMESELNKVMLLCGALNIALALIVAPRFGAVGMAWVVDASAFCASFGAWLLLRWKHLDPFGSDAGKNAAAHEPTISYSARAIAK
jgi:O-antigen/teichoic acid export membrane protein